MRRRGVLLVESAMATALVLLALVAVGQLMAVMAKQERALSERQVAAQEAVNALESAMLLPWDQVSSQELALPSEAASQFRDGQLQLEVSELQDSIPTKKITAEISWQNRRGTRERLRLTAWRFRAEAQP